MTPEVKLRPDEPTDPANVNPPGVTVSEAEALERLARLNQSLRSRTQPETVAHEPEIDTRPARPRSGLRAGRIVKSLLALAAAVALLWIPVQRLLYTTSAQATINARLINLRAPIDGRVSLVAPDIAVGAEVKAGEPLLRLTNTRADRQRVDDLRRSVSSIRSEIAAQTTRLEQLQSLQGEVKQQLDAFQTGRIHQLSARQAELLAEIASAEATRDDAAKSVARSTKLKEQGYQTLATLLHAERDLKVAETQVDAARKRMDSNKIELEAARKGLFVGDSYNDLPRSAQRHDEIEQQIANLTSELDERKSRLTYLEKELAVETDAYARDSSAMVSATAKGRVWEMLTANGEEVRKGQDLMRILDCAGAVVTATVSESVYNKLWIGQPVEFTLHGDSEPHAGTVAGLSGLAAAGSNFAIDQTAMTREPYHVTISVPGLAAQKECNIGRTGSVTFQAAAASTGLETSAQQAFATIALGQKAHAIAAGVAAAFSRSIAYMKPRLGLS